MNTICLTATLIKIDVCHIFAICMRNVLRFLKCAVRYFELCFDNLQTIPKTAMPTKSSFVFVILPLSPLSPPSANVVPVGTRLSSSNSPFTDTSSQVAVTQLVAALANQPYPDRVIRYSYVFCRPIWLVLFGT